MKEEAPDCLRSDYLGLAFKGLRTEYICLVKDLIKQGIRPEDATRVALELVNSLMTYKNNATFAENQVPVHFITEE